MANTIIRLFPDAQSATAAVMDLKANDFTDKDIVVVEPKADATVSDLTTTIASHRILRADAAVVAKSVAGGAVFVAVRAIFGAGAKATTVLERNGARPSGLEPEQDDKVYWDDDAPLSSAIHVPPLLNDPAPFSSFWNLPTLVDRAAKRDTFWSRLRTSLGSSRKPRRA